MLTALSSPSNPRVLVAANSPLARAGLAALVGGQGIDVCGQVADDRDLPDQIDIYRPDAIVWDMGYDASTHLDRLAEVRSARFPIAVLVLLASFDVAAEAAPVLLGYGVAGVLLQDTPAEALVSAIQAAVHGFVVVPPGVVGAGFAAGAFGGLAPAPTDTGYEPLTQRESEVLKLIAEGLPNKQIAAALTISEHTVKFHVNAILTKLGAQSRTEAVVRATRLGFIAL